MRSAILALAGALLAACQSSDVSREVGARCTEADECDERCLTSSTDYPGGFCTIGCTSRDECPDGTTCADREGGVCLFQCSGNVGCGFLGTGWRCTEADLRGGSGTKVMVCRGS
jgi:hypothetical protein